VGRRCEKCSLLQASQKEKAKTTVMSFLNTRLVLHGVLKLPSLEVATPRAEHFPEKGSSNASA